MIEKFRTAFVRRTVLIVNVFALALTGANAAYPQTSRFEIGGHFTFLDFAPTYNIGEHHKNWGFGGRFTYNFNKYVASEAEVDYFPTTDSVYQFFPEWDRKTFGLFGVKAGVRKQKFGVFGKARPGFVHFTFTPILVCPLSQPGPCLQPAKTNFAMDVGGVFEYYVSRNVALRFDAGDTLIHHQRFFGTTHQLQTSAGVVFRFK